MDIFNFLKSQLSTLNYSLWKKKFLCFANDIYMAYGAADIPFSDTTC